MVNCPKNSSHKIEKKHLLTSSYDYCTICKEDIMFLKKSGTNHFLILEQEERGKFVRRNWNFDKHPDFKYWTVDDREEFLKLKVLIEHMDANWWI